MCMCLGPVHIRHPKYPLSLLLGQFNTYKLPLNAGRSFSSTSSSNLEVADIINASWVVISRAVDRSPDRFTHKVPHGLDVVLLKS